MSKKKSGNNIQKKTTTPKKQEIKYEAQPDVQLTPHTLIAMLAIAVSGGVTAIAGALLGNPFFHWLDTIYRNETNETMIEVLAITLFQDAGVDGKIKVLLVLSVVLVGIAAVVSLVDMIRAMAPEKKPMPILAWVALAFSVVSVILFAVGTKVMYDNSSFANFKIGFNFNIYTGVAIAHLVNLVFMVTNIIGNYKGLKRFEKDGKAY